jgi:hypothetical protein
MLVLFALAFTAQGQNTKGDRPAGSREGRFKKSPKKEAGGRTTKRISPKRTDTSPGYSPRGRARGGERAGKPIRPVFNVDKPRETQRAWKGDLAGRRLRHRNSSSVKPYVHRQRGEHVRRNVPDREGRRNVTGGRPVRIESATGRVRNVFPQRGPYVSNSSTKPRDQQRPVSNRGTLARLKQLQTSAKVSPDRKKVKVVPRSASRAFIRHKSINVYANFPRPKKKSEQAQLRDIAGRKLRAKNYETPRPGVIKAPNTYRGRRIDGKDRPYTGPSGYYRTASRPGRAWTSGDIAGRKIRHRNKSSKSVEGVPVHARKVRTATRTGRRGNALPSLKPGMGSRGLSFKGNTHAGKMFRNQGEQLAGGRKVSRKRVDVSGMPVRRKRGPMFGDQGEEFGGHSKGKRKRVDVSGVPVRSRAPGLFNYQGEADRGRMRAKSKSAMVDVNRIPVKRRLPGTFEDQGEEFTGAIKAKKRLKGGGSVSGRLWNNNESPIQGKQPKQGARAATYSGNIKARAPGYVSPQARKAAQFRGKNRMFELQPGFSDQGEEFTGHQRLSRLRRNYIQNKLAHHESLKKRRPEKETYAVSGLHAKVKRRDYVRNKDLPDNATMKLKQTATDHNVGGLHIQVRRRAYVKNDNAADAALKKLRPTSTDRDVGELQTRVRQYNYVRNPSSTKDALKVREPGKAFARATDYQGNIKMQKFRLRDRNTELHPDARFVKTNRNNVREERDAMTNFKLWWARLFKKQETQPDHLKEKIKKPRYDKGEQGMWYD